ncbi:hypothetical protein F5Y18DRAFT_202353 [Xylariaceae sp. FL1019]|nr:hypothetical protein F5Y18DRAFT_202353 [Xylariaceae sp. FL1019]
MAKSSNSQGPLVWVVTGASSGIGKAIAQAAVATEDAIVYAIGRDLETLKPLAEVGCRITRLDVAEPFDVAQTAVAKIEEEAGRIDVLVNAAGYLLEGGVEETSEHETDHVFQTNVFGPLRLIRAALPSMRRRRSGVIINICGVATYNGSPNAGPYCATKSALSALTESLQRETESLGVHVCLAQLGHFRTPFLTDGHRRHVEHPIPDYSEALEPLRKAFNGLNGAQPGNPVQAAKLLVELAGRRGGAEKPIPKFLPLGSDVIPAMRTAYEQRVDEAQRWEQLTISTDLVV